MGYFSQDGYISGTGEEHIPMEYGKGNNKTNPVKSILVSCSCQGCAI